jgi:hypothetical protein
MVTIPGTAQRKQPQRHCGGLQHEFLEAYPRGAKIRRRSIDQCALAKFL